MSGEENGRRSLRVLILSAGTGSFHCGISVRDDALAWGLRARGHDVHLMPLYLPLCLDSPDASDRPLFMGGINMFLQQHLGLCRRTPRWLDALLDQPGLLRFASGLSDMTRAHGRGSLTLSMLRGLEGRQAKEVRRLLAWLCQRGEVDVVLLSSVLLSGVVPAIVGELGIPVVCLMGGEEGFIDGLGGDYTPEAWRQVRANLAYAHALVAASRYAAETLTPRVAADAQRVHVIAPGIDLAPYRPAASPPSPPVIGFLAHLNRIKGLHTVIEAFIRLRALPGMGQVRLHIGGSCNLADRGYVRTQLRRLDRAGLGAASTVQRNLDRDAKAEFLAGVSLVTVAPDYPEAFGLYTLEANACAVPVVLPRRGALSEVVDATGGGVCYPVDDTHGPDPDEAATLATAWTELLADEPRRCALGAAGRTAVTERFDRVHAASAMDAVLADAVAERCHVPVPPQHESPCAV